MPQGSVSRSLHSWNTVLSRCVKSDHGQDALDLYNQMQVEGLKPDTFTFVMVLNACASIMKLEEGRCIHAQVIQHCCESNVFVGSTLIDMYAKCGSIEDAQRVFYSMCIRNVVSWNAMLAGYVKCGEGQKALELFQCMQGDGLKPTPVTFSVVLNACASVMTLEKGMCVHTQIIESGCDSDCVVGSTLIAMYAKCGSVEHARQVFHTMPTRSVLCWNAMFAAYKNCGEGQKAVELFQQMEAEQVTANPATFVLVLNACASIMSLEEGKRIHTKIIESGYESDVFVGNSLVDMYGKCGSIESAERVFQFMPSRNVVSWSAMLAGYVKCEDGEKALEIFKQMEAEGVKPNSITFVMALNACASLAALDEGRCVHGQVVQSGCDSDVFVGNALVDMYAKSGSVDDAWAVFKRMPTRNVVSWNAMLTGYAKCGGQKALDLFGLMCTEGVKPNCVTFVAALNACAKIMSLEDGRHVHSLIIQCGCEFEVVVGNALLDMYAKCGSIENAQRVFHTMHNRNVVSWNSMLAGYVQCNEGQRALELFALMQEEGLKPDCVTFVVVLTACASIMTLEEGMCVHLQVIQSGCQFDESVGSTLVDMYAKCGSLENAERVFRTMSTRGVVLWNAMLSGFAMYGHVVEALNLFQEMYHGGVKVNTVTFLSLLSACSHGGFVDEGILIFESMSSVYNISPTVEHYACMVDLLGRAGHLAEAEDLLRREPQLCKDMAALMALLSACKNHCNMEMVDA